MKINFEKIKDLNFSTNEAYKTLRTNIMFCGDDIKTITVTSSLPNEGKSEVSFFLAKAFSEGGYKTLFIDADIRKSVTVSRYSVDKETVGLTHYLAGKKKIDQIIYETSIDNLDVIFTGQSSPNPSELLGNERFARLIAETREKYDYVIIDCPPLGSVIDAAVVAKVSDGTAIVVAADGVSYKVAQNTKKQLEQGGVRILGVILNKIETGGKGYGYGYGKRYGYGYGYGYGYENKEE